MQIGMKVMSWWNSADAISFASTASQIAVALFGIIALIIGIRSSQLQDRQQQQNLVNIARANNEAAKANERTQQLEHGTAELMKEAAEAKLKLEKLKSETAPRLLTEIQKKSIIDYLKTAQKRPVRVIALSNSQEVISYAKDIRSCLNEGGFIDPTHSEPEVIIGLSVRTDNNDPLVVAYHSEAEVYKDFNKENDYHNILNAFRVLGIPIGTIKSPNIVQTGEVALMISDR